MKTMFSILELAKQIEENKTAKEDFIASTSAMELHNTAEGVTLNINNVPDRGDVTVAVNDHAHNQIGSRVDIPRKYYGRMLNEAPDLLVRNVNHWLHDRKETRMVRTMRNTARAFLSDRYQRIENEQIAEVALPILGEIPQVQFASTAITDTRLYIKAVAPRITGEVSKGDVVQAGIIVTNSEVGAGAVQVQPFVLTLACLNGMVLPDSRYRAAHIGGRISGDERIAMMLSDEAVRADDHAILLKVRDVIRATLTQDVFDRALNRLREAKGDRIEGDVPAAVQVLAKKTSLLEGEAKGVLRHLIEGHDLSRYGLLNAVTRYSQDVENYDRASELEILGGQILDMPQSAWREIATAA